MLGLRYGWRWGFLLVVACGVFGCPAIYVGQPKPCQSRDDCVGSERCDEGLCQKVIVEVMEELPLVEPFAEPLAEGLAEDASEVMPPERQKPDEPEEVVPEKVVVPERVPEPVLLPPRIAEITPKHMLQSQRGTITVVGSGFVKLSKVAFGGRLIPTTFVTQGELQAELDLRNVATGRHEISVLNPDGRSDAREFNVYPVPAGPVLRVLNPPIGSSSTKITFCAHGLGFAVGAVIIFGGKPIPSKRIRADQVCADPTLDLTNVPLGIHNVTVRNPDGNETNKETFLVESAPHYILLDRILPFYLTLGSVNQRLSIYGQSFRKGASLQIGNHLLTGAAQIQYKSTTYMEATIDMTQSHWKEGTFQATVINPNGKKSNSFNLTIAKPTLTLKYLEPSGWTTGCDTLLQLHGTAFTTKSEVQIGPLRYSPSSTTFPLTRVNKNLLTLQLKKGALPTGNYNLLILDNGKKSRVLDFRLLDHNKATSPNIKSLQPANAPKSPSAYVKIDPETGKQFPPGSQIYLGTKAVKTTCIPHPSSQACAALSTSLDLQNVPTGPHPIHVTYPCGTKSTPTTFQVLP